MKKEKTETKLNMHLLKDEAKKSLYQNEVTKRLKEEKEKPRYIQERRSNVVNVCLEAAADVVGRKDWTKKIKNNEIIALSKERKRLREELNNTKDETKRRALRKRRNITLEQIHRKLKKQEIQGIIEIVKDKKKYKGAPEECSKPSNTSKDEKRRNTS